MQLLCPVKGRLLFILLGRSLPVAHHFGKSCHYQLHHCTVSRQPATPASVGPRGHCVHWASACAVSDCGIVSTGVVGPHCFITHCFPSFFIYSICRTVFWLFLPIICVQDFIYDFHFRIEKGHFKIFLCEGGNSQCLLSHQTECNLLPKQHSEKEGPSLRVISIQGASCKKQPGLPTAISLDSPTQESHLLKAEPFAFLEQGNIQHHRSRPAQFSTLRVLVQALYAPVVVDHPAHPEGVCNLKSQGQGIRFWPLPSQEGHSRPYANLLTPPSPSPITLGSDYQSNWQQKPHWIFHENHWQSRVCTFSHGARWNTITDR